MITIHQCECAICQQSESHPNQGLHRRMNLFMSRLDEQQRRWYVAIEAQKAGHGGTTLLAKVTGLSVETIRRGRNELEAGLADRPVGRVRKAGGGRKTVEKNAGNRDRTETCDTPTFAAYAIAKWWQDPDRPCFAHEDKLLILCDSGGSNSCRYWQWKIQVQLQLADQFGIEVMICH